MASDKSRLAEDDELAKAHEFASSPSSPDFQSAGLPPASISYPQSTGGQRHDGPTAYDTRASAPLLEPAVHPVPSRNPALNHPQPQLQDGDTIYHRRHHSHDSSMQEPLPRQPIRIQNKSLFEAYLLCLPLGFLGLHHFYLGRIGIGFLYLFTGGVFGIGWIVDWFRLPWIVAQVNRKRQEDAERGYILYGGPFDELYERSMSTALLLWLPPVGFFGGHHFYLGRVGYGVAYCFTLGLFGIGWLSDIPRMWTLVQRTNEDIRKLQAGEPLSAKRGDRMQLDDAYFLAFPLGFLGLHHFYMRRWLFGIAYFFTGGCAGVGFIIDLCRLPYLFQRTKRELETGHEKFHLDDAYIMWFPFGILGLHHFYLHRWGWGVAYFFTAGILGIGWLVDFFYLPRLLKDANSKRHVSQLAAAASAANRQNNVGGNDARSSHDEQRSESSKYPPVFPNGTIAVYAFPLDQHGQPLWMNGVAWTQERSRDLLNGSINSENMRPSWLTQVGSRPPELPPPYS